MKLKLSDKIQAVKHQYISSQCSQFKMIYNLCVLAQDGSGSMCGVARELDLKTRGWVFSILAEDITFTAPNKLFSDSFSKAFMKKLIEFQTYDLRYQINNLTAQYHAGAFSLYDFCQNVAALCGNSSYQRDNALSTACVSKIMQSSPHLSNVVDFAIENNLTAFAASLAVCVGANARANNIIDQSSANGMFADAHRLAGCNLFAVFHVLRLPYVAPSEPPTSKHARYTLNDAFMPC